MKASLFALAALYGCFALVKAGPAWDDLRVTWNPNPFSSNAFAHLPRNIKADAMGFVMKDNFCDGNQPKGPYAGIRYWKDSDPAVMLIFDKNGIVAGIQTAVPKSTWTPSAGPNVGHPYVDDGTYFTLTAYFVDPSTICDKGRTQDDLTHQGTGTGLYIQNGTDPLKSVLTIEPNESEMKKTKWTYGHCFYTMGDHYWYNVRKDMPCNEFYPACMLYNKGKLNAFCWALNAELTSPRYEHPTAAVLKTFIDPVPDCMYSDPAYKQLSTMHIYFSSELSDLC